MKIITISGALLIVLAVAQASAPKVFPFLPLGGSTIAEMGIIFGMAVAMSSILGTMGAKDGKNKNHDNS
jgi:hypothetical protein